MSKFLEHQKSRHKKCMEELHWLHSIDWFDVISRCTSRECRGILTQFKTIHLFYLYSYIKDDFFPDKEFYLPNSLLHSGFNEEQYGGDRALWYLTRDKIEVIFY